MNKHIPISKNIIQPIIKSNIYYVDSIEDFEKIELEPNQIFLAFDNHKQCFYLRDNNGFGEYSRTKIFFYENFAQRVEDLEKIDFIKKCKEAGLDDVKSEVAYMFFKQDKKPQEVWIWLLENKIKDWSWDYVKNLKCSIRKTLYPKIIKT